MPMNDISGVQWQKFLNAKEKNHKQNAITLLSNIAEINTWDRTWLPVAQSHTTNKHGDVLFLQNTSK